MSEQKERVEKLLLLLLEKGTYMTAEEMARELSLSTKSVYRLIKKIKQANPHVTLIHSQKGLGYKLNYEAYIQQKGSQKSPKYQKDASPIQRQNSILEELLLSAPKAIPVTELFAAYDVGDSAIAADEKTISEWLERFECSLIRKQRTLSIHGSEENIRRAIAELFLHFNVIDLNSLDSYQEEKFNRYDVHLFLPSCVKSSNI